MSNVVSITDKSWRELDERASLRDAYERGSVSALLRTFGALTENLAQPYERLQQVRMNPDHSMEEYAEALTDLLECVQQLILFVEGECGE